MLVLACVGNCSERILFPFFPDHTCKQYSGAENKMQHSFLCFCALWLVCLAMVATPIAGASDSPWLVRFHCENLKNEKGGKAFFDVEVHPKWAPKGAARFKEMVDTQFFRNVKFFRVIKNFMAQFGISGNPKVAKAWREKKIRDDPVTQSNKRGFISFATSGPNSRTTQLFINFGDNSNLDGMGFAPFAKVARGMDVVDQINDKYGEGAPRGRGPSQGQIQAEGNAYLDAEFSDLTFISRVEMLQGQDGRHSLSETADL